MIERTVLAINGFDLHLYCAGEGDTTVMLLHGAGADSAMLSWKEVLPLLAGRGFRVIAPDLPGYGETGHVDCDYSLAFYAQTVGALIEALDCGPVVLGGLSLGGGITLKVALDNPQLLSAIIPVDAWGLFDRLPWHGLTHWFVNSPWNRKLYGWTAKYPWMIRWSLEANLFGDKSKVTDALLDEVMAAMGRPKSGEPFRAFQLREITRAGLATPLMERLDAIALPALLVHGSRDAAVPLAGAVEAQRRMPNARLHIMEGCRHWPQKERPQEFVQVVADFLKQLS